MDRAEATGAAAAGVTVCLWASAFVGIRAAGEDLSAGPLTLGRLLVGAAALGAFVALRRDALPPRDAIPRLLACGLLWFGAYNVLLNAAEQRIELLLSEEGKDTAVPLQTGVKPPVLPSAPKKGAPSADEDVPF